MDDPFDLERFVKAQSSVYAQVRTELAQGKKTSHWMWFVFPQIIGLGHSPMAARYAIRSLSEAEAYLAHSLLGPRLLECTNLVLNVQSRSLRDIFGSPDDMKFRSCMTLFAKATASHPEFTRALRKYCDGSPDPRTIGILASQRH
jgi:uncharacterized protein (DUF1810 family)